MIEQEDITDDTMDNETEDVENSDVLEAFTIIAKDDADGLIQPQAVVEAARDPDSPLHGFFEWDDTAAAAAYRLVQARHLIARITVRVVEQKPALVNVRVRLADGTTRRGYVPTSRAAIEPDLYQQVVDDARRGIAAYRNRLSAFEKARHAVVRLDEALAAMQPTEQ